MQKFHDWWKDRAIPKTRHGAKTALQRLGYSSTNSALVDLCKRQKHCKC